YWAHSHQIQPTFLSTTDHLSTIGYHLGYEHQSHLCTAFKRKYGVSPSLFRDRQNKVLASAPTSRLEVYDDVGR
ncbi:MAG: AraC family transcriptional regulator, partial [Prevotella sp.]|nr:AraC family transcriptional regulator [Prevotella sp.]